MIIKFSFESTRLAVLAGMRPHHNRFLGFRCLALLKKLAAGLSLLEVMLIVVSNLDEMFWV